MLQKSRNHPFLIEFLNLVRNVAVSGNSIEKELSLDDKRIFTFVFTPIKEYEYINGYAYDISKRKHEEAERQRVHHV